MKKEIKKFILSLKEYMESCKKEGKPCLLQARSILLIFLMVVFTEFLFLANYTERISFEYFISKIVPEEIIELANIRRKDADIEMLTVNPFLQSAAEKKAKDMAEKGYFAHTSPEGITPWYWFDQVGYNYRYAGENLAVNFTDALRVGEAWMDSPTHRDNILSKNFEDTGVAMAVGEYKDEEAIFIVQLFGTQMDKSPLLSSERREAVVVEIENEGKESALGEETVRQIQEIEEKKKEIIQQVPEKEEDTKEKEEQKEDQESFVFLEKTEDQRIILTAGNPENIFAIAEKDPEYVSFWGRIVSSPTKAFSYFLLIIVAVFLFTFLLKVLFMQKINLAFVTANEMIVLFIVFSAFLTNHYLLHLFI